MMMDPKDRKSEAGEERTREQELEVADLATIQGAYSRLEATEPPALLDQVVLNTARRELASGRRKSLRWIGAFATASVLVLALTIVVQQDPAPMKTGRTNGAKLDAVAPSKVQEESAAGATADTLSESILPESRAVESGMEQRQMMKQSAAAKRELDGDSQMANEPAAASLVPEFEAAPVVEGKEVSADTDFRVDDAPAKPESVEYFRDETVKLEAEPRRSAQPPEEAADAERAAGERMRELGSVTTPATEQDKAKSVLPDPDEWIEQMLLLRQSELYEQLEEELAAFKLAYPDHPLPAELEY